MLLLQNLRADGDTRESVIHRSALVGVTFKALGGLTLVAAWGRGHVALM